MRFSQAVARPIAVVGILALFLLAAPILFAPADTKKSDKEEVLQIGLSSTVFSDIEKDQVKEAMDILKKMVKSQTGMPGEFTIEDDINQLAEKLAKGKYHLGAFSGYEFGWVRQKQNKLRPLVVAVNHYRHLYAHLMVRKDSPAASFADLQGKPFAMAQSGKCHCKLFLNRQLQASDKSAKEYFAQVIAPANTEEALDEVVDGAVAATVVDGFGLERYRSRKPGRAGRLKDLQKSVAFPAPVLAYQEGVMKVDDLRRFREGMIKIPDTFDGRQMLTLWKLTGFEDVPKDYNADVTNIVKVYPAPDTK